MKRPYVFLRRNRAHHRTLRVVAVATCPQILEVRDACRQHRIERAVGVGQRGSRAILFVDEIHQIEAGRLQEKRLATCNREDALDGGGFVFEQEILNRLDDKFARFVLFEIFDFEDAHVDEVIAQ